MSALDRLVSVLIGLAALSTLSFLLALLTGWPAVANGCALGAVLLIVIARWIDPRDTSGEA